MLSYPLFPLPIVLFPGALLPLHIFEPRYRAMLTDCAEGNHRFVVIEPGPDGPPLAGAIGTVARIRAVQPLPDGRSNIVVSGEERVTFGALSPADLPYLVGSVEVLPDLPDAEIATDAEILLLKTLAGRYVAALGTIEDAERQAEISDDRALISFQVAALLDWHVDAKRLFLAIRSPRERITRLTHALPSLITDAEGRAEIHRKASTNGSGRHH